MSQKNSLSEVRQQAHEEFFVLFCLFVFNFFFFFLLVVTIIMK